MPISWPRAEGQIPMFYAQRPGGRPFSASNHYTSRYIDLPNEPQFPFGHGLTYGRFEYSNLRVTPQVVTAEDTIEALIEVRNAGSIKARETVFVFVHDPVASVARPVLELKGWQQAELECGQQSTVAVRIAARELCFCGPTLQAVFEPGEIQVLAGSSADMAQLRSVSIRIA
jgi:beta-glucosidase